MTAASVVSVSRDPEHRFSKEVVDDIVLIAGLGVEGDAHAGTTVQHRSRVARDPSQPNLRQVHLVHAELFDEVEGSGFEVAPGELGENVTTRGVDLLGLPRGAVLRLGPDAVVEVTGLRNPCVQIDGLEAGLMRELVTRDDEGQVVRKAGVMAVVLAGGRVAPGDSVGVELPEGEHEALQPV
ncbi:MOSC domain-containing protein [Frigoribacterium sp. CFBP 13729]|jgi:MOSC domain-containing protein YiiM|uniref:MOSC domain-containing protein n=1 Tax=Frigoribacterium sp. CFBP 13729 TaxID=2775293 RepID=UPI00178467C6|nr:MOSC domain-containing protein [Frigoribacterium sp. CFBP 13729]MBD8610214.1 MOSC domain-containing protein [Frigoribacterium sp. CFBP 13729]